MSMPKLPALLTHPSIAFAVSEARRQPGTWVLASNNASGRLLDFLQREEFSVLCTPLRVRKRRKLYTAHFVVWIMKPIPGLPIEDERPMSDPLQGAASTQRELFEELVFGGGRDSEEPSYFAPVT